MKKGSKDKKSSLNIAANQVQTKPSEVGKQPKEYPDTLSRLTKGKYKSTIQM